MKRPADQPERARSGAMLGGLTVLIAAALVVTASAGRIHSGPGRVDGAPLRQMAATLASVAQPAAQNRKQDDSLARLGKLNTLRGLIASREVCVADTSRGDVASWCARRRSSPSLYAKPPPGACPLPG